MSRFTLSDGAGPGDSAQLPRVRLLDVDGTAVLCFPRGTLDGVALREIYETAVLLTDRVNARLVIDLKEVQFVSSGAMGMFVTVKKKFLGTGGQMHLAIPAAEIRQQFEVMNLHLILRIFVTLPDAVAAFK